MLGFALTTAGILSWQQLGFNLGGVWPLAKELTAHPVYIIIFGIALIPPTLWEIFILENTRRDE